MTYEETLEFLFSSLPMYHRIGAAAYKADISATERLMDCLNHPENKFSSVHVAGTNGKGSVSHLLAAALQASGLKVGLYTSPHLVDFRERIRVNGEMIDKQSVCDFVARYQQEMLSLQLSFFEMTVGLAFHCFAEKQVDIAVIEVGMGGRLDSTNVITPLLSVITNIGLDHTQFLGSTLPAIAGEKAGIIKPHVPVVIGESQPETAMVFINKALHTGSRIAFADMNYDVHECASADEQLMHFSVSHRGKPFLQDLSTPLSGWYQHKNIATFLMAVEELNRLGVTLPTHCIREALANVTKLTGLRGRWQVIAHKPLTICETAHNEPGVRSMLERLSTISHSSLRIVYGCVNDKDFEHILSLMPENAIYYFTQPSVPRALPVEQLVSSPVAKQKAHFAYKSPVDALCAARSEAAETDLVLVTGSIFLVADVLKALDEGSVILDESSSVVTQ